MYITITPEEKAFYILVKLFYLNGLCGNGVLSIPHSQKMECDRPCGKTTATALIKSRDVCLMTQHELATLLYSHYQILLSKATCIFMP